MNFDKTNAHDDNDYGYFCILEENTHMNNYRQFVYVQNCRYIALHHCDKPSLYPADYYHNDYNIPSQNNIENKKTKKSEKKLIENINEHPKDDDDDYKHTNKKIFIMITKMCIFSMFVSALVIIMTMR